MTSAFNAMEDALGAEVSEGIRALRRLMYCGEWIESHALHVFLLHAPDFLGFESAWAMARDHREVVEGGLKIKAMGNDLLRTVGGRAIHPINVRVGGFYKAPSRADLEALVPGLEECRELARQSVAWVAGLDFPDFEQDYEFVALRHPDHYAIENGRLVSGSGLDIGPGEYEEHFTEIHVPHSTALQSRLAHGGTYFLGPMARYSLNSSQLSDPAREVAAEVGLGESCRNPFKSIVVRAVEILYAFDEALRLISGYQPPDPPAVEIEPQASIGTGWSEAPRGMLWHRYRLESDGSIAAARIVPPTSQNQARIEQDLLEFVRPRVDLPDERLQWECEQAIRNYDPCISCSTHFLKLKVDRS
jgi:coenzyme F420-reducing hydrogenase alpha subunit